MALNSNKSYSDGDVVTLELGSSGVTHNQSISGFHYHVLYDPDVLEPISYVNGGVGSYYGWESISVSVLSQNSSRFKIMEVDMQTDDKNKFLISTSSDVFVKFGYIKFRVINTDQVSTSLILEQTYDKDRENDFINGSTSSYKYIWLYDSNNNEHYKLPDEDPVYDYQEACQDTITSYVNLYKRAYISKIFINNSVIKNFDKDVYSYNLTYSSNSINIKVNTLDDYSVTGDLGIKTLNYGNNTFKIQVISSTGDKREYVLNINYPDNRSSINSLKYLSVSNGDIDFKSEQSIYDLEVDYDVDSIFINSELTDSRSSYVMDYGNRWVDLSVGLNEILIKVISEKGDINTYTINIIRKDATDTCDIKELSVEGYDLNFDSNVSNYSLVIDYMLDKLNMNIVLVNDESSYNIISNENLTNGSRVSILVTDKDGKEKYYYINIVKEMTIPEKKKNKNLIIVFSVITGVGLLSGIGIFVYKKNRVG